MSSSNGGPLLLNPRAFVVTATMGAATAWYCGGNRDAILGWGGVAGLFSQIFPPETKVLGSGITAAATGMAAYRVSSEGPSGIALSFVSGAASALVFYKAVGPVQDITITPRS